MGTGGPRNGPYPAVQHVVVQRCIAGRRPKIGSHGIYQQLEYRLNQPQVTAHNNRLKLAKHP